MGEGRHPRSLDLQAERRSGRQHKWLIHYREDGRDRVESVSTDRALATAATPGRSSQRLERKRLGLIGAGRGARRAGQAPLADHLADYAQALADRGNTPKHASVSKARLAITAGEDRRRASGDLTAAAVQTRRGRDEPEQRRRATTTWSPRSASATGCTRDRRIGASPLAHALQELQRQGRPAAAAADHHRAGTGAFDPRRRGRRSLRPGRSASRAVPAACAPIYQSRSPRHCGPMS